MELRTTKDTKTTKNDICFFVIFVIFVVQSPDVEMSCQASVVQFDIRTGTDRVSRSTNSLKNRSLSNRRTILHFCR